MDIRDYLAHTDTTAIYPGAGTGSVTAFAYVGLGLAGESSEVLEKELAGDKAGVASELGDVAWYIARLHRELDVDPADTFRAAMTGRLPAPLPSTALVVVAGRAAEQIKKIVRDDASTVTEERRTSLTALLVPLASTWLSVNFQQPLDPSETLAANVAKLADRKSRSVLSGSGDHR